MKDIAYLEIALRNAYDRVLTRYWDEGDGQGKGHWLFDENSPIRRPLIRKTSAGVRFDANALNRSKIEDALPKGVASPSADKVIANLPFGFWAHMTDKAHERVLWIPAIHHAWPRGTDRSELDAKLRLVNRERNRIAHHEHLFNMGDDRLSPLNIDWTVIELLHALLPDVDVFSHVGMTSVERFACMHPMAVEIGSGCADTLLPCACEESVRAYFKMWIERDFTRFDELFSADCRYEECYGPVYEGLDELHRWIEDMLVRQVVTAWDIHEYIPAADEQTLSVTWTFAAREEERSYAFDGVSLIHFNEAGLIDRVREFKAKRNRVFPQRVSLHDGYQGLSEEQHVVGD